MGKSKLLGLILVIALTSVTADVITGEENRKDETPAVVAPAEEILVKTNTEEASKDSILESLRPTKGEPGNKIVISKDNMVPFLKTIILAVTHREDPTYTEVLKLSGKSLLKLAEKKIGGDKYMGGLLSIVRKYVENFDLNAEVSDEEQEILGDLAEEYLKKHQFEILFPETLLLHQPEMEEFVAKRKELGAVGSGRQLNFPQLPTAFNLTSYYRTLVEFTANITTGIRSRLTDIPFLKNLNLDRIGTTFGNIGDTVNEYLPSIRQGAGLPDVGISIGSLTALAAAGALISAPFFMSRFGGSDREDDENDIFYNNRRASPGGVPYQQLVNPPPIDEAGNVMRPQWLDQYEKDQYGSGEPQQAPNPQGEEYNKYLNEHNQWLAQYDNTVSQNQNQEYEEYYKKYREWYNQYYTQQFGESPPQHYQSVAPNAYDESNAIPGMQAPPPAEYNYQQQPQEQASEQEPTVVYQGTSNSPVENSENENKSFQVIHVDEAERRVQEAQRNQGYNHPNQAHTQQQDVRYLQQQEAYNQQQQEAYNQQQQETYNQQPQETYTQQQIEAYNKQQESYKQQQEEYNQQQEAYKQQQQKAYQQQQQQEAYKQQLEEQYRQHQLQQQQQLLQQQQQQQQETYNKQQTATVEQIPQASSLISQALPVYVSYNHQANEAQPSPRPVYRPNTPSVTQGGFQPIGGNEQYVVVVQPKESVNQNQEPVAQPSNDVTVKVVEPTSNFGELKPKSQLEPQDQPQEQGSQSDSEVVTQQSTTTISSVTSGIFKTSPEPTPKAATTPKPKYYKKPYNKSVRVVTSKSVVTSAPVVQPQAEPLKTEETTLKKRKITLPELLQQNRNTASENSWKEKDESKFGGPTRVQTPADDRVFNAVAQPRSEAPLENEVPIYALDPFYGPRLSRTDAIFAELGLEADEVCREQVVCNMYKNPNAYTPLSDQMSRQLTVTMETLKRPTINDQRILRFFNYLTAARYGQDGNDCAEKYAKCRIDTTSLSYQPIVNAFKKVSILMNAGGSS